MHKSKYSILLLLTLIALLTGVSLIQAQDEEPVFGPRVVAYISSPAQLFTVTDQAIPVIGTVIVDPEVIAYWKVEIR